MLLLTPLPLPPPSHSPQAAQKGALAIRNNPLLKNVGGIFTSLAEVSGAISLADNLNLMVTGNVFPSLVKMGVFALRGSQRDNIMRNLSHFGSFDKVTNITESVVVDDTDLEEMFKILPALQEVGGSVEVKNNDYLKRLTNTLPSLRKCKSVAIYDNDRLANITSFATNLAETGKVDIVDNDGLTRASTIMPSLVASGAVAIRGNRRLRELDAESWKSLQTMEGSLVVANTQLTTINAFGSAQNISGTIELVDNDRLQVPSSTFKSLVYAGGVSVQSNDNLTHFDGFTQLKTIENSLEYAQNGVQYFGNIVPSASFTAFRALEEASAVVFTGTNLVEFPSFRKLKMLELLDVRSNRRLTTLKGSFGALVNVSKLRIDGNPDFNLNTNDFAVLEHAGELHIQGNELTNGLVGFAQLSTVERKLTIQENNNLTSIPSTAFGALVAAGGISIVDNTKLANVLAFAALEKVLGRYMCTAIAPARGWATNALCLLALPLPPMRSFGRPVLLRTTVTRRSRLFKLAVSVWLAHVPERRARTVVAPTAACR